MPEKILIIDDEIDTLRLVGMMLESKGYLILSAESGRTGIEMAQTEGPDLILLDIMMPGLDGFQVTRQLRDNPATSRIPLIIFTAKSALDDRVTGLELGADAYLTKPISSRELCAQIKAVLARTTKQGKSSAGNMTGSTVAVIAPKGGMGTSTVAANLSVTILKGSKKDTILADFRPGMGSLSVDLGLTRPDGLNSLLESAPEAITRQSIESRLIRHVSGLRVLLSTAQPKDARYSACVDQFETIARLLPEIAPYVCLDLAPAITPVNEKVLRLCHWVVVIVEPAPSSVLQGKALIQDIKELGLGDGQIEVVMVNRVRTSLQMNFSEVEEQMGRKIKVVFTPDPELAYQASIQKAPMVLLQPEGFAARQFEKLAAGFA